MSQRIVEIPSESEWMRPIKAKLRKLHDRSPNLCIYRVPNKLRQVSEASYSPRIVSIGPFHHGRHELLAMEEHKWRYTLSLLHRTADAKKILKDFGHAIEALRETAQQCYAEKIEFQENELAEMLLVDGCFILELFIRRWYTVYRDATDPILKNTWMIPALQHDLALLENQIPLFVLEELFRLIRGLLRDSEIFPPSVTPLALAFFYPELKGNPSQLGPIPDSSHLVHLLHKFYCLPTAHEAVPQDKKTWGFRHGATKLLEAGIQFEMSSTTVDHLLHVQFIAGVLKIPPLSVDTTTGSRLRNFIALEQCAIGSTPHNVTSYAILINSLVHSSADMELLQRKGIIINNLGTGERSLSSALRHLQGGFPQRLPLQRIMRRGECIQ